MPTAAPAPAVTPSTSADRLAGRYWRANLAALSVHQPRQAECLAAVTPTNRWSMGRDGSLTSRDAEGQWFAGCSVPLLAGRALLRSLAVEPGGHCLLAPAHAGLVVAARERLGPEPVLFVIQPDLATCGAILSCCDVSADLGAGRLWFAAGDDWAADFHRAFQDHPGLAAPARFIQTRLTPSPVVEPLITAAQQVIGTAATTRVAELDLLRRSRRPVDRGRTVVIAGSRFRLWQPGPEMLRVPLSALHGLTVTTYDIDDPLTASPMELARATCGAEAVVAINLARGDAAAVVGPETRWITWQTRPGTPAMQGAGPDDHLIVADPAWQDAARAAGWPRQRVHVGICPPPLEPLPTPPIPMLGIIADTCPIEVPGAVGDYSSQQVLWEAIAAELRDEPLALADPAAYLDDRSRRMGIDPAELSPSLFIDGLIRPSYTQGLARRLIAARLPIKLWGRGWSDLPEFADHAMGPVLDSETLQTAIGSITALIRPVPNRDWHPIDSCGRFVLSATGLTMAGWISRAATTLRHPPSLVARPSSVRTLADTLAALTTG